MSADVEQRLRRALAAQAARVTPERLRPALPPTAAPARRPLFLLRLGLAAAALLLATFAIVALCPDATPEIPQQPPSVDVVTPSPSSPATSDGPIRPSPSPSPGLR